MTHLWEVSVAPDGEEVVEVVEAETLEEAILIANPAFTSIRKHVNPDEVAEKEQARSSAISKLSLLGLTEDEIKALTT